MKKWKWYYKHGTAFEIFSVLYDKDDYVVVKNDDTETYNFGLKKDFGTLCGFPINQSCLTKEEIIKQLNAFIDIDKKYLKECPNDWFMQNINRWKDMILSVESEVI